MTLRLLRIGKRERQPRLHARVDEHEIGRHHADDGIGLAVDTHVTAQGVSPAKKALPQSVAQYDRAVLSDLSFLVHEAASDPRRHPREAEERWRHPHHVNPFRRAIQIKARVAGVEERLLFEDGHVAKAIVVVGDGGAGVLHAGLGVTVVNEQNAIRLRDAQRPQEHVVHDSKQGRIGADTDRQRQGGRDGEGLVLREEAKRDT
jgi:hypothetical protein